MTYNVFGRTLNIALSVDLPGAWWASTWKTW